MQKFLTVPDIAQLTRHPEWRIRYILMRDRIDPAERIGRLALFTKEQAQDIGRIAAEIADKGRSQVAPQDAA